MKVLLINPPYQTLTSNLGVGHQVPLGLLMVGGPLIDAGHAVKFLDAECLHLSLGQIVAEVRRLRADVVMTGHAGSTPAHPVCVRMLKAIKAACPHVWTVYGGVFPTYHPHNILLTEPAVDFIVLSEGEATALELVNALEKATRQKEAGFDLEGIQGIAYRNGREVVVTEHRHPIDNLDGMRVGWELIEKWDRYQCFGLGRAAVIQFSRGCPHRCTYCGQHGFWVKWRYRDPRRLADEIAWLYHTNHVRFFTIADENPTTLKDQWRCFLEEVAAKNIPVHFFATIRATDIVRDADILHLYRAAGILYVLMGIETTDEKVIREIQKKSTTRQDYEACQLLKRHGIFSIIGHIVGFADERWETFRRARRALALYDGDYLNAMYVTPHSWTEFAQAEQDRGVVQQDQRRWDYRHQVLGQRHMKPWQMFLAVKWLELCFHLRPKRLWRMVVTKDKFRRGQMLWCQLHTGLVWLGEVVEFLWAMRSHARNPITLSRWFGWERRRGKQTATSLPVAQNKITGS